MCLCWGITMEPHSPHWSALFTLSLSLSLNLFYFPSCLYFLTVNTVLYMLSARVRGQLLEQCLYCVVHMEKLTAMGQFSPWSYVNSFDGMSGLSPAWRGIVWSEGFHHYANSYRCISNPFVEKVPSNRCSCRQKYIHTISVAVHQSSWSHCVQLKNQSKTHSVTAGRSVMQPGIQSECSAGFILDDPGAS